MHWVGRWTGGRNHSRILLHIDSNGVFHYHDDNIRKLVEGNLDYYAPFTMVPPEPYDRDYVVKPENG